jgi:glycosyltransferase involved in cell wall biosynthesis
MKGSDVMRAKPTICIDCRYVHNKPSGIGEMVGRLIEHVPAMAPDLDFLLLRHKSRTASLSQYENVREVSVGASVNGPGTLLWLPWIVDLAGVDLFHATANILPRGLSMPAVTTVHDIMWLNQPELCNSRLWGRVEQAFYSQGISHALRRSTFVATVSKASRDAISAHAPHVSDKLVVTRSGVADTFTPGPVDPQVIERIGIPAGKRFVLTVGQYAPYKNHEGAVEGFANAFATRPGLDLVLLQRQGRAGAGLAALAERLGIKGRVHLLKPVASGDLVQLYRGAEALLHPSFCEGFGNPLAEAMACGCPVVTSNLSAMPEVTSGAALLVNPGEPESIGRALQNIVEDDELAASLRRAGLARAAELDWRDFAAKNLRMYRRALGLG